MNVKKLTTLAMLTAISMIVFLIEAQIPLPFAVPGIKLGIANVITLFVLWMYGWKEAGGVLIVRIIWATSSWATSWGCSTAWPAACCAGSS